MKTIHVSRRSLPEAWQQSVLDCWEEGAEFKTEYDKKGDPLSRDVLAVIHVHEPFLEPRIHRAFPGGLNDLEKYRNEVLYGVHDHWVDPEAGKWQYTYHDRLFNYTLPTDVRQIYNLSVDTTIHVDQIEGVIRKLKSSGHTRRAQAITWQPWNDMEVDDPACLQRLWFRVEGGNLNMVCHMRSNDAYKAAFMNMYAFTELQKMVADRVGVPTGHYVHVADSYHIYGSYFDEFRNFIEMTKKRSMSELCWDTGGVLDCLEDGVEELLAEPDMPTEKKKILFERLSEIRKYCAIGQ